MNILRKPGLLILILISVTYVYFSFFAKDRFQLPKHLDNNQDISQIADNPPETKPEIKNIKIFVADSEGKIRPLNRECNTATEKSCFAFAIKELLSAPTNWEKSKGFISEIPPGTKILSIREGEGSIMIDLSNNFENGGGTESICIRLMQLIKTAKANTGLPVYLYINGKQAEVIGGEGIMIKQPLNERSIDG